MKIGKDKRNNSFYVYQGANPSNQAIFFLGSFNQCKAFIELISMNIPCKIKEIEYWIKQNQEEIDSWIPDDLDYLLLTKLSEIKKSLEEERKEKIRRNLSRSLRELLERKE